MKNSKIKYLLAVMIIIQTMSDFLNYQKNLSGYNAIHYLQIEDTMAKILLCILSMPILFIVYIFYIKKIVKDSKYNYKTVDDKKIKEFIKNFNREQFLKERYNEFIEVQKAQTNYDYVKIRKLCTDELFNQFFMKIETQKVLKQKQFLENDKYIRSEITGIENDNGVIRVYVELIHSCKKYTKQRDKIVKGSKTLNLIEHYGITFVMKEHVIDKCPNCHAKLSNSSSQICEYCRTKITRIGNSWTISKIELIKKTVNTIYQKF